MIKDFIIKEFGGIDQSKDESKLELGSSPDACNIDTTDGNLSVAKGYEKFIDTPIPGNGAIKRLHIWRDLVTARYIVIAGDNVYAYVDTDGNPAWTKIYTYDDLEHGNYWDFLETKIGNTDYLIIANGEKQLIKWDGDTSHQATVFGASEKQSNVPVNFLAMHYSRLFAAGDPDHPSRLYWSCVPGAIDSTTYTIEDWQSVDESTDKSGGHVEVGDTSGDPIMSLCALSNQLVIFKRNSIYRLLGDRPSNFRIVKVNGDVEETVDSSIAFYGDRPFWMTKAGMYYYDGQSSQKMFNARNIKDFLETVTLQQCKGAENRDKLYFTCREKDQTIDNAIIVYDIVRKTYMIRKGFKVIDICAHNGTLYMINDQRYIYKFESGTSYDGVPIQAYWKTPLTDLDAKADIKTLKEMYFRGTGTVILVDSQASKNVTQVRKLMPNDIEDVVELNLQNEGRVFKFKFSNEAGSYFSIKGGILLMFDQRRRAI